MKANAFFIEEEISHADNAKEVERPDADLLITALWRSEDRIHQLGLKNGHGFQNHVVMSPAEGATRALEASDAGSDAYFACAEYYSVGTRTAANASCAWAFWLDLDCGDLKGSSGSGYDTWEQAQEALQSFCYTAGLPLPTHRVLSGLGVHVYWVVDSAIPQDEWRNYAIKLKALTSRLDLRADPSRTADIASVLRVPGTQNYKYTPSLPVKLLEAAGEYLSKDRLLAAIEAAHVQHCAANVTRLPVRDAANDDTPRASVGNSSTLRPDLDRLESALKCLDPDCDEATWKLKRIAPMARVAQVNPELASKLHAIARSWSSGELRDEPSTAWSTPGRSNGLTGEEEFANVWRRFSTEPATSTPTTLGTIFHDAAEAGWVDPDAFVVQETEVVVLAPAPALVPVQDQADQARTLLNAVEARVKAGDVGAPFEADSVSALQLLAASHHADYQRIRTRLKQAHKGLSISALDRALRTDDSARSIAPTHHGYAKALIDALTVNGWPPVAHDGSLYTLDGASSIWVQRHSSSLDRTVAERFDGSDNCTRQNDYRAIGQHATSLVSSDAFFAEAPIGIACPDGFYRVEGSRTVLEPLTPGHRQRVRLSYTPKAMATPMFSEFLHETFASEADDEEAQQISLLQEIAGSIMLGLMHRHHKAVLFYDPFGRSGKGTTNTILLELVPKEFTTAVSPFVWDKEYFIAALAGSRFNVVGELPEDVAIPTSTFKSVIGGDLQTGRHPSHRPITFRNEAAHLFMSNHLINSRDHSEAFFARWLVLEFPNSRLKTGLPLDPGLAARIIQAEMPGVAHWALEGATRLLRQGHFSPSLVQERLVERWRRGNSSLEEYIHECCDFGTDASVRRAALYRDYQAWCGQAGRKAFSKARVKDLLSNNLSMGIKTGIDAGNEVFRGVSLKPEREDPMEFRF